MKLSNFCSNQCLFGFRSIGTKVKPLSSKVISVCDSSWLLLFRMYLLALIVVVLVDIVVFIGVVVVGGDRETVSVGLVCL